MSNKFDPTQDLRNADLSGFSPALLIRLQKYVPTSVIKEVWQKTGGEPELTRGIFTLLLKRYVERDYNPTNIIFDREELEWLDLFIELTVVDKWQTISELAPLRDLEVCLLNNPNVEPFWLLKEYQQILNQEITYFTNSEEQKELLELEIVVLKNTKIAVANYIYEAVFNNDWLEQKLKSLSPYQLTLYRLEGKSDSPQKVLEEILAWTNNNLFLTKIVCYFVCKSPIYIPAQAEAKKVNKIVKNMLLNYWQKSLAAPHLMRIQDRLLRPESDGELKLLKLYRRILTGAEIFADSNAEHDQLLRLGLLKIKAEKLVISNRIYREIFNLDWVEGELVKSAIPTSQPQSYSSKEQNINVFEAAPKRDRSLLELGLVSAFYMTTIILFYGALEILKYPSFPQPNIEGKQSMEMNGK